DLELLGITRVYAVIYLQALRFGDAGGMDDKVIALFVDFPEELLFRIVIQVGEMHGQVAQVFNQTALANGCVDVKTLLECFVDQVVANKAACSGDQQPFFHSAFSRIRYWRYRSPLIRSMALFTISLCSSVQEASAYS